MSVNDNIRNALERYGGFSINERVYNYLGSLGYTGTISDRLAKYSYEDKKGWQALIARYAGTGWTPATLFAEGQQGVWYEPKPEYLYQDAAGTVPVTADGDPVGNAQDLSPNDNELTQPISADRPTYNTDESLHWLGLAGVNNHLNILDNAPSTAPYASIGNQCSGFFAVRFDQFNSVNDTDSWVISSVVHEIRNLGSSGTHVPFSIGANGDKVAFGCASNYVTAATKISGTTPMATGQVYVIGFVVDGANLTLYLDGQVEATSSSLGTASRSPSDGAGNVSSRLGIRTTNTNTLADPLFGSIFGGVVVDYAMTQSQVDEVNSYLAGRAGKTL